MSSLGCLLIFVTVLVIADQYVSGNREGAVRDKRDMQMHNRRRFNRQDVNDDDDVMSYSRHGRRRGFMRHRQRRLRDRRPSGGSCCGFGRSDRIRDRHIHGNRERWHGRHGYGWSGTNPSGDVDRSEETGSPDTDGQEDRFRTRGMRRSWQRRMLRGRSGGMPNGESQGSRGMHRIWHGMNRGRWNDMSRGGSEERYHGMPRGRGYGMHRGMHLGMQHGMHHGLQHGMHLGGGHHSHHHTEEYQTGRGGVERRTEGGQIEIQLDPVTNLPMLSPHAQRKLAFLSAALNNFNTRFYNETVLRLGRPHLVYSPYGIFQTLAMIFMGSQGHTTFEMIRLLHLVGMGRHIHLPIMQQNLMMTSTGNSTLEVANCIFVNRNITISETFSEQMERSFGANVSHFNLDHPDGPEYQVNECVSEQTHNKIQTVLAPGTISADTSLVIVNAMYFNGKWKTAFPVGGTVDQMFPKHSSQQVAVSMMEVLGRFKMGILPGHPARLLELPYEGDRFSMIVVLPNEIGHLSEVEEALLTGDQAVHLDTALLIDVKVRLPRFRYETTLSLKNHLQNIWMRRAFAQDSADLRGISSDDVHVSDVFHKVVVDVTEEDRNVVSSTVPAMPYVEFFCEHPFMFIIRDNVSKINLFIGKFTGSI